MTSERRHVLMWLGLVLVLPFADTYLLNAIFYRPPHRPTAVPEDAIAFKQGEASVWWWASCRELEAATYQCRLFDERASLAVSGRFVAEPRPYSVGDDDNHQAPAALVGWPRTP